MEHPYAVELLTAELNRLLRNHYADGRSLACEGCRRAEEVERERADLAPVRRHRRAKVSRSD